MHATVHVVCFMPYATLARMKGPDRVHACLLQRGHWQEGKCLVFDDSFEHEAWRKS